MEPEDLPWPGELEEEEEEEEPGDEVVVVEEVEGEEAPRPDPDFSDGGESSDGEEDEEAKAWLQAAPARPSPPWRPAPGVEKACAEEVPLTCRVWQPSPSQGSDGTRVSGGDVVALDTTLWTSGGDQKTESWHCLPQETDFSQTLDTSQTRLNGREEGAEVTDFPSLEEGVLAQSETRVEEHSRGFLCSPLLVIQNSFASPDLPLLTCMTQDQEFGPEPLFHQSGLDFAPLRGIPDTSEDTEWFSRPSKASEALFQTTSEVASDFTNSCFGVSQHPLPDSTAAGSQHLLPDSTTVGAWCTLLPVGQEEGEEAISPAAADERKTHRDSDAVCSYVSLQTKEAVQQPEASVATEDQLPVSSSSDLSDENRATRGRDSFDAACSYMQCWKQEAFQQSETCKDVSFSDSSDTIDESEIPLESGSFDVTGSCMPWWREEESHCPTADPTSADRVSLPHQVASHFQNKVSRSVLHCFLERRGEDVFLTSDTCYFESAYLGTSAEKEAQQKLDSLEGPGRDEGGLEEESSQCLEQKETGNHLVSSGVLPRPAGMQHVGNTAAPESSLRVSEPYLLPMGHDTTSAMQVSFQTAQASLGETPGQLYFQKGRSPEDTSALGGQSIEGAGNVAFEAVIASIEPSEKERTADDVQTDVSASSAMDSQERGLEGPALPSPGHSVDRSVLDQLHHPLYQSTPEGLGPAPSEPVWHKKGIEDHSLYWYRRLDTHTSARGSPTPELKAAVPFHAEPSPRQTLGADKPQPAFVQGAMRREPFLLFGKIKSFSAVDLADKMDSVDINPAKGSTSDSLILQELKLRTSDKVADSSDYIMEHLHGESESGTTALDDDAESWSLDGRAVTGRDRAAGPVGEFSQVGLSGLGISQSFSSTRHSFVPRQQTGEPEYPSSDLRMLRVSSETVSQARKRLPGDPAERSTDEITQTRLKSGRSTTSGDSAIRSDLPLPTEAWPQVVVRSTQQKTVDQHTDSSYQQIVPESHLSEQTQAVTTVSELANQKTGMPTGPSRSHSLPKRPSIFYQEALPDSHLTEEAPEALAAPGLADQSAETARVTSGPDAHGDKRGTSYRRMSDSDGSEGAQTPRAALGPAAQETELRTVPSSSLFPREKPGALFQRELSGSVFPAELLRSLAVPGPADQETEMPTVLSSYLSQHEQPHTFYQQVLPSSHLTEETQEKSLPFPGRGGQKPGRPAVLSGYYSSRERPDVYLQQTLPDSQFTTDTRQSSPFPEHYTGDTGVAPVSASSSPQRERPGTSHQQGLPDGHLTEQVLRNSPVLGIPPGQKSGIEAASSGSSSQREKPAVYYQQTLPDSHQTGEALEGSAGPGRPGQKPVVTPVPSSSYAPGEKPGTFYEYMLPDSRLTEEALRSSPVPGTPASSKPGLPAVPPSSSPQRKTSGVFYQQTLSGSRRTGEALKGSAGLGRPGQKPVLAPVPSSSYAPGEKPGTFYEYVLPDSRLTEEALRSSPVPGAPASPKPGLPAVPPSSSPQRETSGVFYQQTLSDSHRTGEALKGSPGPGRPGQKSGIPSVVPSSSYLPREEPGAPYQQVLTDYDLTKEALRSSPVPGTPASQKPGLPAVSSSLYPQREKPGVFYQQTLSGSHLTEETLKGSPGPGRPGQKPVVTPVPSSSYVTREKPGIFYEYVLPDSRLTEEALRSSPVPGTPASPKPGLPAVPPSSSPQRETSGVFYQQTLSGSHLTEETLKGSPGPGRPGQKSLLTPVPSSSYAPGEKPGTFYEYVLPDSRLTEEALRSSPVPGTPVSQKPGLPAVPPSSSPQRETSGVFYQQTLSGSHLTEETLKGSPGPGRPGQKSLLTPVPSSSYAPGEKPGTFYEYVLPDSRLTEEALRSSPVPGTPVSQKPGLPAVPPGSSPQRETSGVFYQQTLSDSHRTGEALKGSAGLGRPGQKPVLAPVPSSSYAPGEKPGTLYEYVLPDSRLTEEALRSSPVPGAPASPKPGLPAVPPSSSPQRETSGVFYQQTLSGSHLTEEALKGSPGPGRPGQKSGIPSVVPSSSYLPREEPGAPYQQVLTDYDLTMEALRSSPVPGTPASQKPGLPAVSSSLYPQREKPGVFYQQTLSGSHLTEETLKGSPGPGRPGQKSLLTPVPSSSYAPGEKPGNFYEYVLPDSRLTEEALRSSPVPGTPASPKPGLPAVPPSSSPQRETPGVFYQQTLSGLTEEALRSSAVPGTLPGQRPVIQTVFSSSYLQRENPGVLYQQKLPDSPQNEQVRKDSAGPGRPELTTPPVPSRPYLHGEEPGPPYQQAVGSHWTGEAPRGAPVSGASAAQKAGLSAVSASPHPQTEKPGVFYQHMLSGSFLSEELLKNWAGPGRPDQESLRAPGPSSPHSPGEDSPGEDSALSYQQVLPGGRVTEEARESSSVPGSPADQKAGPRAVASSSPSHAEDPGVLYQQVWPGGRRTEEDLKSSAVAGIAADQKTGPPTAPSHSPSKREKPSASDPQALPDSPLTEEVLEGSPLPGPADPKSRPPTVPSRSHSHREKAGVFSQQELPESHLAGGTLKVSAGPGAVDRESEIPTVPRSLYPQREAPGVFYQQVLPDSPLTEEALRHSSVPGPTDQEAGIPTSLSSAYSPPEKPSTVYQQNFPVSPLTEEALKGSDVPGPTDQEAGIPTSLSSAYSAPEKPSTVYQQNFPVSPLTEEALRRSDVPGPTDQEAGFLLTLAGSGSHRGTLRISPVPASHDQETEPPRTTTTSGSHTEKSEISAVMGPDGQKAPLWTVFSGSYSERVKPSVPSQQELPDRRKIEEDQKGQSAREPTDRRAGVPVPPAGFYAQTEKSSLVYPSGSSDARLTGDAPTASAAPGAADQKAVSLGVSPSSAALGEKPGRLSQQNLANRQVAADAPRASGAARELPGVPAGAHAHREEHRAVSGQAQEQAGHVSPSDLGISSQSARVSSRAGGRPVVGKPGASGSGDLGSEEARGSGSGSKTLKEIQTLLMEAENMALRRCSVLAPLLPFRDGSDVSCTQPKKVVCFREPVTADECDGHWLQKEPSLEEMRSPRCVQKDTGTQTDPRGQRDLENWELTGPASAGSSLQEAGCRAGVALEGTFVRYDTARSVMRSEPEGCSGARGSKLVIPVMRILRGDSSSDTSDGHGSCSGGSHLPESLESLSDVLLDFLPEASPHASLTDSRDEEDPSESDDGGSSSGDSLAARVRNLLQCESSLNHARQTLRDAEEEESRVRARAWKLRLNLAHDCGYSISELNEDDRRKVEEIKAKLFGHRRQNDLSQGLQSPRGLGCMPEAVCSHVVIESHEKGCFRTQTAQRAPPDSHPCVFRAQESAELLREPQVRSAWRAEHISLSKSQEHSHPRLRVWNSLQLGSHSPSQSFTTSHLKISRDLRGPFGKKLGPWSSASVGPAWVPAEGQHFHSSSQVLSPEPLTKFATTVAFSSHRHSKCVPEASVLKISIPASGLEASQGVSDSHFEEQNPVRDQDQKPSSPRPFRMYGPSPYEDLAMLAESSQQSPKSHITFEHSHQEELLEVSGFTGRRWEPSLSAHGGGVSSMSGQSAARRGRDRGAPAPLERLSLICLEQRELLEQCQGPHPGPHLSGRHSPPPRLQNDIAVDLPSQIFREQRELFEQSKASHVDDEKGEGQSPGPQGQGRVALDLPSDIFHEQRELLEQNKPYVPFPLAEACAVEKDSHREPSSCIADVVDVGAKLGSGASRLLPSHCAPPSDRKALSCVRITLSPKSSSKLECGNVDKMLHSVDPVCTSGVDRELRSGLQAVSSGSWGPASESRSLLDVQAVHVPLPQGSAVTQDVNIGPTQKSLTVTSRETQVSLSDLERYFNEGTPVSAVRAPEETGASPGKRSSDAVTQITTESPEKTSFSSEIFINIEDHGRRTPEPRPQQVHQVPIKFASVTSVQQTTSSRDMNAQPSLLPYKPSGSTKMYYVPQLEKTPPCPDTRSDTTLESSHPGSNDAVAPDFPAQVLGTRRDDLSDTVCVKHKEGVYSKRAVTGPAWSARKEPFRRDTAVQVSILADEDLSLTGPSPCGEKGSAACSAGVEHSAGERGREVGNPAEVNTAEHKVERCSERMLPKTAWVKETESLQTGTAESSCHPAFESPARSVFRSTRFYFRHPVRLPHAHAAGPAALGRGVILRHSWKDVFQRHPDRHKALACPSPGHAAADKTQVDYTRIESVHINLKLGTEDTMCATKSQAGEHPECDRQVSGLQEDQALSPEPAAQGPVSLNELWNRYQERQRQQKPHELGDKKELSLVERLDRLAKLLQYPITLSLQASEGARDGSREERGVREGSGRQHQQRNRLQKKRHKDLEKCHRSIREPQNSNMLSHQAQGPNQIQVEHIKFNKYILSNPPGVDYLSNTSSDSRPSEESELFTDDSPVNIFSTTTSPVESEFLAHTDREGAAHERSSSISTIDTVRLIQAFGHERVCVSPRRVRLYSTVTSQRRRCLEKQYQLGGKAVPSGHFPRTAEHPGRKSSQIKRSRNWKTRDADSVKVRRDVVSFPRAQREGRPSQVEEHAASSDSFSSSVSGAWSSCSALGSKQRVQVLHKGIQTGNLEIMDGARRHTRDVGVTFPTPSSSEARLEDSDLSSLSEEKHEEKRFLATCPLDKKLKKNKSNFCEGISWFVPVENLKSGPKKENLLKSHSPGISWFEPVTSSKPWREPLREKNWQGEQVSCQRGCRGCPRDPCRGECVHPLRPFVRASLQESLQLHRPDFISSSGERVKRLKLIVQERKLQSVLQSERDMLFNTGRHRQGCQDGSIPCSCALPRQGVLTAQKSRLVGKKEMMQRSKRMYEQLPEIQKRKEEEKRKSEYRSYRLRAQLYKKKVTNRILGRKVPWD